LSGILTQFYFREFRGNEFFNSHRDITTVVALGAPAAERFFLVYNPLS
jgi:hypothetical protein